METSIFPLSGGNFFPPVQALFSRIGQLSNCVSNTSSKIRDPEKRRLQRNFKNLIPELKESYFQFHSLAEWDVTTMPADARQAIIYLVLLLRHSKEQLEIIRFVAEKRPFLTQLQYKELKVAIKEYFNTVIKVEKKLALVYNFSLSQAHQIFSVGNRNIKVPFRIQTVPDGTGYHVTCFEVPQLYGFGETPEEARAMLEREILSLYEDLNEGEPLSSEFQYVKDELNWSFENA